MRRRVSNERVKGDINLDSKRIVLDDEISDDDIDNIKKELNMNVVEHSIEKSPSDDFLFMLEGKGKRKKK